jgi:RNA polymerase sigma-70 factor (ECF subfamily)
VVTGPSSQGSPAKLSRSRERALIKRAQGGCRDAACQLVDWHQDRLFAFVWRMVRNHHEAEEVCQEAFLRAFGALGSFRAEFRFSTWLFTIGYRLCLNAKRRRPMLSGDVDVSGWSDSGEPESEQVANSEAAQQLRSKVWQAVDQLSEAQRAAVLLFYREDLSCQQISEVLDIPVATVKSHLHRARQRLRGRLASEAGQDWSVLSADGEIADAAG